MEPNPLMKEIVDRYQRLQRYVGWTGKDVENVLTVGRVASPAFDELVDDFYEAIQREPETARLITGGQHQIERLKGSLRRWLDELFAGVYDAHYVARRWQVGRRHVEIGLRQVFADAPNAILRSGLHEVLHREWTGDPREVPPLARSFDRLLDLELALIEDAYTTERLVEQRQEVKLQSEATFRKLVESARCIIVILRADLRIAYFNRFAEQVTGYSAMEVMGQEYLPLFVPQRQQPSVSQGVNRLLSDGGASLGYEYPLVCRDGGQRLLLWNAQKLDDYDGLPAVLAVGHDITEL